jgi:uncharacterized membrane protein YfcA
MVVRELLIFATVMVPVGVALALGAPEAVFLLGIAVLLARALLLFWRHEKEGDPQKRERGDTPTVELAIYAGGVVLGAVSVVVYTGDLVGQISFALIALVGLVFLTNELLKRSGT